MIPTLQYLVAEYLELNGEKTSAQLAKRFSLTHISMRCTLRSLQLKNHITTEGGRPQVWAFNTLPPKYPVPKAASLVHGCRLQHKGFDRPDLSAIAALPLMRL